MGPKKLQFGQRGAIVSIRLQNFMTYDDCKLTKPSPNLNMILGPNGSGKSALVCAIIVGLAGDVSLTSRATSPAQLVQRGRDWAITTIELYNDRGKNYIVQRKIIITGKTESKLEHKSEWKLNDKIVLKSAVQQLMRDLNIKVDNLCQFLPQDSVAQFVKMTPSDLLTNTLKAAGDNRLVEQHNKLIEYSDNLQLKKRELGELKEACKHNEVNARRLETEVEKLREREEMIKKKKVCSQKIHYVRYVEAEKDVDNGKEELRVMEERLKQARDNANPFRQAAEACRVEEGRLRQVVSDYVRDCGSAVQQINTTKNKIEDRKIKCQQEFSEFKSKETQENQREQQIRLKQQELDSNECRLNEIRDVDYTNDINILEKEMTEVKTKLMKSHSERQSTEETLRQVIPKIEEIKGLKKNLLAVKEKKIQIVNIKRPESHRVIEWLAKNTDKFTGRIYPPMLCEIDVPNPRNASYLETIISESDLFAFVCENENDLRKLTRIAREELRCKINVILMPEKSIEDFENESSTQDRNLSQFKPDAYLKDFIEAPEPILRYLYGQYDIHRIPVFKNEPRQSELMSLCDKSRKFFGGNRFYTSTRSRYDNEPLTATEPVREGRLLINVLDSRKLKEYDAKLAELSKVKKEAEDRRIELNKECDEMNKDWHGKAEQVRKLKAKQEEKKRIEARIAICRQNIESLMREKIDLAAERLKLQASVGKLNHEMTQDLLRMAKVCDNFSKMQTDLYLNALLCTLALRNYKIAHKRYKAAMDDANTLGETIREHKVKVSSLERTADRLREFAEEKIPTFRNKRLSKATKQQFESIEQSTADAIELYIEELKVRIRNICHDANNTIMNEFNRETEELREKQSRISELEVMIQSRERAMKEIKEDWLPRLKEVLGVIDQHYQDFMQKLNYGGKVDLDHDASKPDDFRSYGIMIMVKYRDNEQLIPLSSTRQSGGERSVATMIYMLALQTKTTVPFRVVDEINQGMDKDNERKVFELLVRTADESSSQYFLVSPKLLSGLNYGDKMQIHVVFNGRNMEYSWESFSSPNGDANNCHGEDDEEDDNREVSDDTDTDGSLSS